MLQERYLSFDSLEHTDGAIVHISKVHLDPLRRERINLFVFIHAWDLHADILLVKLGLAELVVLHDIIPHVGFTEHGADLRRQFILTPLE